MPCVSCGSMAREHSLRAAGVCCRPRAEGTLGSEAWDTPLQGLGQGRRKAELAAMLARVKEGRAP